MDENVFVYILYVLLITLNRYIDYTVRLRVLAK